METILVVVSRLEQCGPMRQLYEIIRYVSQYKRIKVITLYPEQKRTLISDYMSLNIDIYCVGLTNKYMFASNLNKLKKIAIIDQISLVYSYGMSANVYALELCRSVAHCTTLRMNASVDMNLAYGVFKGLMGTLVDNYILRKMDYIVCCSKTLFDIYKEKVPLSKLLCITNGVNVERFFPLDREKAKEKLKIGYNAIILLVCGSIDDRKNTLNIIRAFNRVKDGKKRKLILAGTGPLLDMCKKEANKDVVFLDFVDDVVSLYSAADIYISASYSEGLPNSVLEAGAVGCPMILSDIPQHREIFGEGCKFVRFFSPSSVEQLTKEIQNFELLEESRNNISYYFRKNYSSKKMASLYNNLFDRILALERCP